jgi:6-phosphogluconolactonase (cycloisomerase 2 family)
VTVDQSGRYVYVANAGDDTISQFTLGANGTLPATSTATVATGAGPDSVVTAY